MSLKLKKSNERQELQDHEDLNSIFIGINIEGERKMKRKNH